MTTSGWALARLQRVLARASTTPARTTTGGGSGSAGAPSLRRLQTKAPPCSTQRSGAVTSAADAEAAGQSAEMSDTLRVSVALAEKLQRRDGGAMGPRADRLTVQRVSECGAPRALGPLYVPAAPPAPPAITSEEKADDARRNVGFGTVFTDHMLQCSYRSGEWGVPRIVPRAPLQLDPAASVLHYGLEVFEGLKAYRPDDDADSDTVRLFRPMRNVMRMYRSAARLALPIFEPAEMLSLLEEFVRLEAPWVPRRDANAPQASLYLRPALISTDPRLGVRRSGEALLFVLASPALGDYYADTNARDGITLLASDAFTRAWPGGVGDAKCGGNYAPGLVAQELAAAEGCHQVLWLHENRVTEAGVMNFFVVMDDGEVVTPSLNGMILPGLTRDSVTQLVRARRYGNARMSERDMSIDELVDAIESGRAVEAFGTGTAAVVSPVSGIKYKNRMYAFPRPARAPAEQGGDAPPPLPLSAALKRDLEELFYGAAGAAHEWIHPIKLRRRAPAQSLPARDRHSNDTRAAASASRTQFG